MKPTSANASVHLPDGSATFSRDGDVANLHLEVHTPCAPANITGEGIEEAISRCCQQEIEFVTAGFIKLGIELVEQLDDRGDQTHISDMVNWKESRSWKIESGILLVDGTEQRVDTQIGIADDTSDAALVREAIRVQLNGRLLAIRDVYRVMLTDVLSAQP